MLYTQKSLDGDATVLLDPNTLSSDGTVALMGQSFSEGGSVLAYSLSSGGSDWRQVRFLVVDSASGRTEDLPDELENVKFSSMAWSHDDKYVSHSSVL